VNSSPKFLEAVKLGERDSDEEQKDLCTSLIGSTDAFGTDDARKDRKGHHSWRSPCEHTGEKKVDEDSYRRSADELTDPNGRVADHGWGYHP
jgi:hypothetical protein